MSEVVQYLSSPALPMPLMHHCYIAYSGKDCEVVEKIEQFLTSQGLKCWIRERDSQLGYSRTENISRAVFRSRRAVIILSKNYLKSKWYEYEVSLMLANTNQQKRSYIIPVVFDLEEADIPGKLAPYQYLTFTGYEDLAKIGRAVAAVDIPLHISFPCGHVAEGLAWSFFYGYLNIILPALGDRCRMFKHWLPECGERRMVAKLYILIPESGFCPQVIGDNDNRATFAGLLEPYKYSRAGVKDRMYQTSVYKFVAVDGQEYYAPTEYATPIQNMYEMTEHFGFSGLCEQEKRRQIKAFSKQLDAILSHSFPMEMPYSLINYKDDADGKHSYTDKIIKNIQQTLRNEARRRQELAHSVSIEDFTQSSDNAEPS